MYAALSVEVECFDPTLAHQGEKNRGLAPRLPIFTGSSESFRGPKGFQDSIWFAKSKEMVRALFNLNCPSELLCGRLLDTLFEVKTQANNQIEHTRPCSVLALLIFKTAINC